MKKKKKKKKKKQKKKKKKKERKKEENIEGNVVPLPLNKNITNDPNWLSLS